MKEIIKQLRPMTEEKNWLERSVRTSDGIEQLDIKCVLENQENSPLFELSILKNEKTQVFEFEELYHLTCQNKYCPFCEKPISTRFRAEYCEKNKLSKEDKEYLMNHIIQHPDIRFLLMQIKREK